MKKMSAGVFKNFFRFFLLSGTLCAFFALTAISEKHTDTFFLSLFFACFSFYTGSSTLRASKQFSIQFTADTLTICRKSSMWIRKKGTFMDAWNSDGNWDLRTDSFSFTEISSYDLTRSLFPPTSTTPPSLEYYHSGNGALSADLEITFCLKDGRKIPCPLEYYTKKQVQTLFTVIQEKTKIPPSEQLGKYFHYTTSIQIFPQ